MPASLIIYKNSQFRNNFKLMFFKTGLKYCIRLHYIIFDSLSFYIIDQSKDLSIVSKNWLPYDRVFLSMATQYTHIKMATQYTQINVKLYCYLFN